MTIPFNRPQAVGGELENIEAAIAAGSIGADGEFTGKCQTFLQNELGAKKALLTTSCTAALEMAALLLDLAPGDEVIVPSFNFPSSANAFVLRGAKPVFADIRADTLNLDEKLIESHLTSRTRAIVPMHYAGVACEMDAIVDLARKHSLAVIEDNAHGLFAKYKDRHLGTFGDLAAQSFHSTKNLTCGEGGALLLNDERFVRRAEIIREKGTNRDAFFRGEVDKYTWVDLGSSYAPSDILAAFLYAQLQASSDIQSRRKEIWDRYAEGLRDWSQRSGARLPVVPSHVEQSYHIFFVLMPDAGARNRMITHLRARGVQSAFHYVPLHLSKMGRAFDGKKGDCPVSEDVSERLLRLPFYNDLSAAEQKQVVAAVEDFC